MDQDLGLEASGLLEEHRVMQCGSNRAIQAQYEKDVTDIVSRVCKILDLKEKPPHLEREQEWQEFEFKMKILGSTMGIESEMDEAATTVADASDKRLTVKQQAMSRVLYLLLMQDCSLDFPCLRVLSHGEGFQVWQELCRKLEPKHPDRYALQLTDLLNPSWATMS